MKKTIAALSAAAVAAATLGTALPATAASATGPQIVQAASHPHPRFYTQGKYAYYNGHRGDRHRHPGWRYYNGWWFPPAAFIGAAIGGAIIGGMIAHAH